MLKKILGAIEPIKHLSVKNLEIESQLSKFLEIFKNAEKKKQRALYVDVDISNGRVFIPQEIVTREEVIQFLKIAKLIFEEDRKIIGNK